MSITFLRQPFLIINNHAIATEVLDRRGNNYADRPTFEMANLCGWGRVLSRLEQMITCCPVIYLL